VVGMGMIIGRSITPLKSSTTTPVVRRLTDDNSRRSVQNVRADSSVRKPALHRHGFHTVSAGVANEEKTHR
jgi:hypothetical protein